VDDGAECSLREVQDENGDAKFLVSVIQMFGSGLGNQSNSKSYPDNYDWSTDKRLQNRVALKPHGAGGPEVSRE